MQKYEQMCICKHKKATTNKSFQLNSERFIVRSNYFFLHCCLFKVCSLPQGYMGTSKYNFMNCNCGMFSDCLVVPCSGLLIHC